MDLDIAAPKITIPTDFYPDSVHPTKLLIDLGKLMIRSQVSFSSLEFGLTNSEVQFVYLESSTFRMMLNMLHLKR